ncbi:MAG: heme exporter protein CcmB [Porticoccaceae bacterium]
MTSGYHSGFIAHFSRDVLLHYRRRSDLARPLVFFVITSTLVPLGVVPEPATLATLAPGIIWIIALLATLLSIENLFAEDWQDGTLEQMLISPNLLVMPILGKVAAHWLMVGLPLTLISPLIAMMLYLPAEGLLPMLLSLALGTAALSLVGAVGAALTLPLQQGGMLLALLVMPLYTPILIFGSATVQSAIDGLVWSGTLATLTAILALAIALCPLAIIGALRLSSEY